ncbi:Hypothetical predicted protein [Olea europaea subsp. europaea]|uniref:Uncharacterized protein n=1 Tax=Olea europaea subsp. europaea TaxID=158383 RepID=A0A8S0PC99_OLEEU|nr:Hypothetical predicted protein [Olea europaea subsp. europaea]
MTLRKSFKWWLSNNAGGFVFLGDDGRFWWTDFKKGGLASGGQDVLGKESWVVVTVVGGDGRWWSDFREGGSASGGQDVLGKESWVVVIVADGDRRWWWTDFGKRELGGGAPDVLEKAETGGGGEQQLCSYFTLNNKIHQVRSRRRFSICSTLGCHFGVEDSQFAGNLDISLNGFRMNFLLHIIK